MEGRRGGGAQGRRAEGRGRGGGAEGQGRRGERGGAKRMLSCGAICKLNNPGISAKCSSVHGDQNYPTLIKGLQLRAILK